MAVEQGGPAALGCAVEEAGDGGRGEPPSLCLSPKASLVPKLYAAPRGRGNPRRRRMRPLSTKPSNSPRPPFQRASGWLPPPHPHPPQAGSGRPCSLPTPIPGPADFSPGDHPYVQTWAWVRGAAPEQQGGGRAPRARTPNMDPHPPGAGAQPTYMSTGRRPDAGLAAGAGAAAAGAAPGRRRPSSGRLGPGAGRTAESAAPPARFARRVHPARASPLAGSSHRRRPGAVAPTRVSARAALRRSSSGLVPASPRQIVPRGRPGSALLLSSGRRGELPVPGSRRLGYPRRVGGRRDTRSAAGEWR